MWPDRRLCDLLNIEHPIIQAPMGGLARPELAAAVSRAGGLGSLSGSLAPPAAVRAAVGRLKTLSNGPFNLNFLVYPQPDMHEDVLRPILTRLRPYYEELGLDPPTATLPALGPGFDATVLELILELHPPVVSFHFGIPDADAIAKLKAAGIVILHSATSVAEAQELEASGIDAVIAQGWEAGGHRGSRVPQDTAVGVGTLALVPQIADAIKVPVIAAGGIADGRGVAAAFALGASGVQIGSAFLSCDEAGSDVASRAVLRNATDTDTVITAAYSGRPARARRTRYTIEMDRDHAPVADFPTMALLRMPLSNSADFAWHLYGQAAALNRELGAGKLMKTLVAETRMIFDKLSV
jgi:nitronate monooxygenase